MVVSNLTQQNLFREVIIGHLNWNCVAVIKYDEIFPRGYNTNYFHQIINYLQFDLDEEYLNRFVEKD